MFVGYCVLAKELQGLFQPVRVYKSPPFSKNIAATDEQGNAIVNQLKEAPEDEKINRSFNMRQIREHDLILLTNERLPIRGDQDDIKQIVNAEFLRSLLIKQCAMFGFVTQKNIGSPKDPA